MLCHECNKKMKESIESYRYVESGLDNVYLNNICVYRCDCGEMMPSIFRVAELNSLIGENLINKPGRLTNKEIIFLRKNAGMKAKEVYHFFDTDKSTYSRWENGKQKPSKSNDMLFRLLYAHSKNYPKTKINKILNAGIKRKPTDSDDIINIPLDTKSCHFLSC